LIAEDASQLGILVKGAEIVEESITSLSQRSQTKSKILARKLVNLKATLETMRSRSITSNTMARLASLDGRESVMRRAELAWRSALNIAEAQARAKVAEALDATVIRLQEIREKIAKGSADNRIGAQQT